VNAPTSLSLGSLCRPGVVVAAVLLAGPANAEEYPVLSGGIEAEIQVDHLLDADDGDEGTDLYTTIEPYAALAFTPELRLETVLVFEPVEDRAFGEDRAFENHGLYVDTLALIWETERYAITAGKFAAPFGLAHDFIPGLYGDTFSETYELTERLGLGGSVTHDAGFADLTAALALFRKDTTFLSESAFNNRGRTRVEDGGSGNTDWPENVSFTLAATPAAVEGLTVQASVLRQAEGEGDDGGTWGWGLGAAWEVEVGGGVTVVPVVEYVRAEDALGFNEAFYVGGGSEDVVTGGVGAEWMGWGAAVAGGWRDLSGPAGADADQTFVQVSLGYTFDFGLGIETGWVRLDDGDQTFDTVGAVVAYGIEF